MDKSVKVRKKRKFKCPNPLFEQWLIEWKEEAASKGLKSHYNYSKALASLRKYPLPLASGKEAKVLEHFGIKICSMLDEKLQEYRARLNISSVPAASSTSVVATSPKSAKKAKPILKSTISKKSGKKVTGAVAAPTLFLSSRLPVLPSVDDIDLSPPNEVCDENEDSFTLQPGFFNILLCVDNCETFSGHGKNKKLFLEELKKSGVEFNVRKLNIGDFLWVAREKLGCSSSSDVSRELVLDFVIERKRMDDLAHSIKDGRFREQKFRLRSCGVRRPIYLVEYHNSYKYSGIPESTLEQAIINTQIVDGFTVQRTKDVKESVAYLSVMTKHIQNIFQNRTLKSGSRQAVSSSSSSSNVFLTFEDFNRVSIKNKCLSIREMFIKHLLQFHGLSVDRAAAVVDRFETPQKLVQFLKSCPSENERIKALADIRYGKFQRTIGQALGKVLQHYYCSSAVE